MFSLIVATIDRTSQLERFLKSMVDQSYSNFEIIIVDQNLDNRLESIITKFQTQLKILHLHSSTGLSKARNLGLEYFQGDVVAFPDDDCWYSPNLLSLIAKNILENNSRSGITGRAGLSNTIKSQWKWDTNEGWVTRKNVWTRAISISVFLKRDVIFSVGRFDDTLGAGSGTPWGSGEETDFIVRAVDCGHKIWYDPSVYIFHDDNIHDEDANSTVRALLYGAGMGRVLRKQRYPFLTVTYFILRPMVTSFYAIIQGKFARARHFAYLSKGRAIGWLYNDMNNKKHNCD